MAAVAEPADSELPKALIKRIIKTKLSEIDAAHGGDGQRDFQVNKDALLAFCESGKLFIHYLTATANDVCKDAKRQTISADDVLTALDDLEFGELVEPLKQALEGASGGGRGPAGVGGRVGALYRRGTAAAVGVWGWG